MSQTELISNLQKQYQSVSEVIENFKWLENYFLNHNDLRGVFVTAYLHITQSIGAAIEEKTFQNNSWSQQYLICFANLYREAILNYEQGNLSEVPKSWEIAFNLAKNGDGYIIQHLLLGVNAHINHDLALALHQVSIDPNREEKYQDHTDINLILEKATDGLKRSVAEKYAPILKRLDRGLGTIDDEITAFSIPKAREHSWSMSIALTSAQTNLERAILQRSLDDQAAVLARLILASPIQHPKVKETVSFLKWIDQKVNWFVNLFR
ncbi:DUF5995 family protein [Rhodohalobacter sulfatireducens]|uniref:DUF5995 family protein n=1 Tax=Rhodohalobacter sulfatireducens TaxID=2911366 RepID=A0ABS9K9M7_9BACT|nr:DUF5995 family protein [Rhodohalobacter sulfatireducens]